MENLIDRQVKKWEAARRKREEEEKVLARQVTPGPVVTVSRQRGSQGTHLAKKLAERLGYQLIHRQMIDYIVKESGARRKVIESLDEKVRSEIELWVEGLSRGSYLGESDYFYYLMQAILTIAKHGEAVIVGRGANYILGLKNGLHVRIVATAEKRIENLMKFEHLSREQAKKEVESRDKERDEFIRRFIRKGPEVPEAYDLVLNTTNFEAEDALDLILRAFHSKFKNLHDFKMSNPSR